MSRRAGAAALLLAACGPPFGAPRVEAPRIDLATWRGARADLAALRARLSPAPGAHVLRLALTVREPSLGRLLEARGAVAREGQALRMILLGPGGTTALDLWIRDDRYRLAVPALDLVRRGDRFTPLASRRGLPVDFLRWWLLDPAAGALLAISGDAGARTLWLRPDPEEEVVVSLEPLAGGRLRARRFALRGEGGARTEERVESDGRPCGVARYEDSATGLAVEVRCEGVDADARPDPAAFLDPDTMKDLP